MKVSIIIPTYNRGKYIGITIQSFLELNYPKDKFEIIVANNNSTDNTEEVINQYINNPFGVSLRYIFEPRQGVHYARNTAARIANFELLYFTDDDMIADKELLNEILKPFQFNNQVAIATGKVLPNWEVQPPKWILKHCNNHLLSLLNPAYEFVIASNLDYLYSCHLAIKRTVFFEAEGFNPEYTKNKYLGDGETGLNMKIKALGYKFGFNNKSVIFHIIPKTRLTQKYLNRRLANAGRAHSYSAFKANPTTNYLLKRIAKNLFIHFPYEILKSLIKPITERDFSLFRFFIAKTSYYYGSVSFEIEILTNPALKKFVMKKDWLTKDKEFDTVKI
jgi:glycosyltransferase involved in cell wall biosynthesis